MTAIAYRTPDPKYFPEYKSKSLPVVSLEYSECTKSCEFYGDEHFHGNTLMAKPWIMPPDLARQLREAREGWALLEAAGTPYWCIHKGREVSHPRAEWKKDGYTRADGKQMQYKHGVICNECGGYIQEG